MTAKEKAKKKSKDLLGRFEHEGGSLVKDDLAKQCALIAVDEIIEALKLLLTSGFNNDFDILKVRGYYMEIKQEIEKL